MASVLIIKSLSVSIEGKEIIKKLDFEVKLGEVHAIMGPNGSGKSTLAKVLAGHPSYEIVEGDIWFCGQNLLEMSPSERAHAGLFMGFQYPMEIPGVSNRLFLRTALNAKRKANQEEFFSERDFEMILDEKMKLLDVREEFKERGINEGFSGGEKKRNEILQMAVLDPILSVLDETDSGLDIDAIRSVSKGINTMRSSKRSMILITHYQRLLESVVPDYVHIFQGGHIVETGGKDLALYLEEKGYQ